MGRKRIVMPRKQMQSTRRRRRIARVPRKCNLHQQIGLPRIHGHTLSYQLEKIARSVHTQSQRLSRARNSRGENGPELPRRKRPATPWRAVSSSSSRKGKHIPIATVAKENRRVVLPFAATRWPWCRDPVQAIAPLEADRTLARPVRRRIANKTRQFFARRQRQRL